MPQIKKADWTALQDERERLVEKVKELEAELEAERSSTEHFNSLLKELIIKYELSYGITWESVEEMSISCVRNVIVDRLQALELELQSRYDLIETLRSKYDELVVDYRNDVQPLKDKIVELVMDGKK